MNELERSASIPVVAGVASIPSREHMLKVSVWSIYWQVDTVYVYLNNYEKTPDFLVGHKFVIVHGSGDSDLKDVGKFAGLSQVGDAIYFSIDDDIAYPANYVSRMMEVLRNSGYKAVVGVHGVILPHTTASLFSRHAFFHFQAELSSTVPVSLLGTGTVAFRTSNVPVSLQDFPNRGMADIDMALYQQRNGIPALVVPRPKGWLTALDQADMDIEGSLYDQTRANPAPHNKLLKRGVTWGEGDIVTRAEALLETGVFSLEMREAIRVLRRIGDRSDSKDFFASAKQSGVARPVVDTLPWIKLIAEAESREKISLHVLATRSNIAVRKQAVSLLWECNKPQALKFSKMIADGQPNDWAYQLLHAQRCHRYYYEEDADLYYNRSAKAVSKTVEQSVSIDPGEVLFQYFVFLFEYARFHESERFASLLSVKYGANPMFRSVQSALYLALRKPAEAADSIRILLTLGGKKFARSVDVLILFLASMKRDEVGQVELGFDAYIDRVANSDGNGAVRLLKLAVLLHDHEASQGIWAYMSREKSNYLAEHPEVKWFYFTNDFAIADLFHSGQDLSQANQVKASWLHRFGAQAIESASSESPAGYEPLISVILCVYNSEQTLEYSMRSILNQTHRNIELIVVDDASTDGSWRIATSLAESDNRIKLLSNEENSGPYVSRNSGIREASGEFVAFQDADDLSLPERLEIQVAAIKSPEVKAVVASHIRMDVHGRVALENDGSIVGHGPVSLLARKEVFEELGDFKSVRTRGDKEFENRLFYAIGSHAVLRIDDVVVWALHDMRSNSHVSTAAPEAKRSLIDFKDRYRRLHQQGIFL